MTDTDQLHDALRSVDAAIDQTINRLAHPSGRDMAELADEFAKLSVAYIYLCNRLDPDAST